MKLHLRDLFWLVLVCALGAGWWVEKMERQRLNRNKDFDAALDFMREMRLHGNPSGCMYLSVDGYDISVQMNKVR
jgi:hypothetical protein